MPLKAVRQSPKDLRIEPTTIQEDSETQKDSVVCDSERRTLLSTRSAPQSPTKYGTFSKADRKLRTSRSYRSIAKEVYAGDIPLRSQTSREKEKVWYDNYTAIDFNRDQVLDAKRLEILRSRTGASGRVAILIDAMQGWVLCLLGVVTAFIAYMIMLAEVFLYSAKLGICRGSIMTAMRDCPSDQFHMWQRSELARFVVYVLVALVYAVLASGLTMATVAVFPGGRKFYMAAGSGIPEIKTILSGFVIHGFLGVRTLIVKAVGLTLAVATGMALGKEGPFVMISSCVANILSRFFPKFAHNETKRREIFSAACAAGVAVAFGSPIGGVLFALEEVSYYFPPKVMHRSFFCAAVAAVTLKSLNPHGTGKLILLETNYEWKDWHTTELPIFLLLGLLGGLYGAAFCALNLKWSQSFRKLKFVVAHPILEVAVVCMLTSVISYWSDLTQIGGTELVDNLLSECSAEEPGSLFCPLNKDSYQPIIVSLLWALLIRSCLVVVTFGLKVPAGIFVPTMVVGALAGRIIGLILERQYMLHPSIWFFRHICPKQEAECIVPGIYAMIGAAATLAGVTRMTVSLAVIMFELTGSLSYVLPYMIAIMTAKWTADIFDSRGIYELIINLNDHPYINIKETRSFGVAQLNDLLPSKSITLRSSIDVTHSPQVQASKLRAKVHWAMDNGYDDAGFALVSNDSLVGYISVADLSLALDLVPVSKGDPDVLLGQTGSSDNEECPSDNALDLRDIVDQSPLVLQKAAPMELASEMFKKLGLRYIAVLDGNEYLGTIDKKRFVKFLRED